MSLLLAEYTRVGWDGMLGESYKEWKKKRKIQQHMSPKCKDLPNILEY